ALLQIHTPDSLRGRISGLWLLQGYVAPALGGLQSGALAGLWSPGRALLAGGSACTAVVLALAARPRGRLRQALWNTGFQRDEDESGHQALPGAQVGTQGQGRS